MIRQQLRLQILLPVVITMLITGIGALIIGELSLRSLVDSSQQRIFQERLKTITQHLTDLYQRLQRTGLAQHYRQEFQQLAISRLRITYLEASNSISSQPIIIDADGTILLGDDRPEARQLADRFAASKTIPDGEWLDQDSQHWWIHHQAFPPWNWHCCFLVTESERLQDVYRFRQLFGLLLSTLVIITSGALIWLINRRLRPIKDMTLAATAIKDGNLDVDIVTNRQDELGLLAETLDAMQHAIRRQIADKDHEIDERRLMEMALRESQSNLATTLDSIADAVFATNADGQITRCNPSACRVLKKDQTQILGYHATEILRFQDQDSPFENNDWLQVVLGQGTRLSQSRPAFLLDADQLPLPIDSSVAPIRSSDGTICGCVLVFRDISDRLNLEEQLRHSQKMDAIGQLAGGVAHDFNNMLGAIQGAAELLQKRLGAKTQQADLLKTITTACNRASDLTNKLLAFSRKGKNDTAAVEVHQLIRQTVDMLQRTIDRRIQIECQLQAETTFVDGDSSLLHNALLNLGINARDAMQDGGTVSYQSDNLDLTADAHPDLPAGHYLRIRVCDTGTGIPESIRNRIFEPFFTTKDPGKGTGLGLAAVYGSIQEHHGSIRLAKSSHQGTCFEILLPCRAATRSHDAAQPSTPTHLHGTVLLVEDEETIRDVLQLILKELGLTVLVATDGRQGLERFQQEHEHIDVCIIDMIMPVMNGSELFDGIQLIRTDRPVILMSGYLGDQQLAELKRKGLFGFLAKPARQKDLSLLLQRALGPVNK
jgi:PAS domain S-box-containing protein